jgi:CRISPR-associated exonuclease Cas4
MFWILAVLGLALLVAGWVAWGWGKRQRVATGLPPGAVVYSDTGAWETVAQPLLSRRYGLVGKPDYLVRVQTDRAAVLVPVEVKSRTRPVTTPDSHILQLATYCLLVEDVHQVRPPYGLLHYADATLQIPFSDDLRQAVIMTADEIRRGRTAPDVHRNHDDPARCRGCGYRRACGEPAEEQRN